MQDNNSNFLMAVVLSLGVLLGWQFFVVEPRLAEERARRLPRRKRLCTLLKTRHWRVLEVRFARPIYRGAHCYRRGPHL